MSTKKKKAKSKKDKKPYYIEPKEGRLVIFPSWMSHQVTPNFTNEDRISYSFNITYQIQNYWKVRDDR